VGKSSRMPPRDVVMHSAHAAAVTNYFGARNLLLEHRLLQETVVNEAMVAGGNLRTCVKDLIKPFVIGVCGATCSGKTTLCNIFRQELRNNMRCAFIPSDSYYKDLDPEQRQLAYKSQYDFDHPDAIAWDELVRDLRVLKRGY